MDLSQLAMNSPSDKKAVRIDPVNKEKKGKRWVKGSMLCLWFLGIVLSGNDPSGIQRQELSLKVHANANAEVIELSKTELRFSLLNKGLYPYGQKLSLTPVLFDDLEEPLCKQSGYIQGSQGKIIMARNFTTCRDFSNRGMTWLGRSQMVFLMLRSPTSNYHEYSKVIEKEYDDPSGLALPYNLGVFIIHPDDFDKLARSSNQLEMIVDLRIPSLGFSQSYREIAVWLDPNNLYQYLTLGMLHQLSQQVATDTKSQTVLEVRPFFNVIKNDTKLATKLEANNLPVPQNLYCLMRFPNYCIAKDKYGRRDVNTVGSDEVILQEQFTELLLQTSLHKLSKDHFYNYIQQFASLCILELKNPHYLPLCARKCRKLYERESGLNFTRDFLTRDVFTLSEILESEIYGQARFGTNPFRSEININGLMIKVD